MFNKIVPIIAVGLSLLPALQTTPQPEPQFALVFHETAQEFSNRTGSGAPKYWEKWGTYIEGIQKSGKLASGSALQLPATGTVLGSSLVNDQRLRVSGYLIIQARNLEEAKRFTVNCPAIEDGGAVEIRPLLAMDQNGVKQ